MGLMHTYGRNAPFGREWMAALLTALLISGCAHPKPGVPAPSEAAVTVTGVVAKPGFIAWQDGLTVRKAIDSVGGFRPSSEDQEDMDLHTTITRKSEGGPLTRLGRVAMETPLRPGDLLAVGVDLRGRKDAAR